MVQNGAEVALSPAGPDPPGPVRPTGLVGRQPNLSGTEWYRVVRSGTEWCRVVNRVVQSGTEWYGVVQSGTESFRVVRFCSEWYRVVQSGTEYQ